MSLTVRTATPEDLPALGRMGAGLVRFHHALDSDRFMLPADDLEGGYTGWLERELKDKKALLLVAEQDGRLAGYIYGRVEGRDWGKLLDRHGELIDLWVEQSARGTGAGRALVQAMLERFAAAGMPRVVLYSAQQNLRAQALFEAAGFRRTMVEMTCELPRR